MYVPNANNSGWFEQERRRFEQSLYEMAKKNHAQIRTVRVCESCGTHVEGNATSTCDCNETTVLVGDQKVQGMEPSEEEE